MRKLEFQMQVQADNEVDCLAYLFIYLLLLLFFECTDWTGLGKK